MGQWSISGPMASLGRQGLCAALPGRLACFGSGLWHLGEMGESWGWGCCLKRFDKWQSLALWRV